MKPLRPPPIPTRYVEKRMLRVADEDDDRLLSRSPDVWANPNFVDANGVIRGWGWHPPITAVVATREEVTYGVPERRRVAGYFTATLAERAGVWRISCWGGDDTGYVREGMKERTARNVYAAINDHTPIRTLKRLGFRSD